jgi:C4-dicarboxylate transporter, DctQ subunit
VKLINAFLDKFEDYAAVFCFAWMCIVILIAVFLRYVVHYPFPWGEELARYLMIYGVFLGISIGTRKKAHLGVEAFVNMVPKNMKKAVLLVSALIQVGAYCWFAYLCVTLTLILQENGQSTPSLRVPTYLVYGALPLGFILSAIRSVQVLWNDYFSKAKDDSRYEEVQV